MTFIEQVRRERDRLRTMRGVINSIATPHFMRERAIGVAENVLEDYERFGIENDDLVTFIGWIMWWKVDATLHEAEQHIVNELRKVDQWIKDQEVSA